MHNDRNSNAKKISTKYSCHMNYTAYRATQPSHSAYGKSFRKQKVTNKYKTIMSMHLIVLACLSRMKSTP